jgi:hypothetical protein
MKTLLLLSLILICCTFNVLSQNPDVGASRKQILEEGLMLFRLEKASWNATDILFKDHSPLLNKLQGYLSYAENRDNTKTIFWDKEGTLLLTITFDSAVVSMKKVDNQQHPPTPLESDLIKLRNAALTALTKNEDRFFSFYENTSPNLIPVIKNGQKTVIILTASRENKLLIGNDYRISFNNNNELIRKEKFHNSLITIGQESGDGLNKTGSMHTHIREDQPFMTSTDICTYMLYKDVFKLQNHIVVSEKYTSIFDSGKMTFAIVPTDSSKK